MSLVRECCGMSLPSRGPIASRFVMIFSGKWFGKFPLRLVRVHEEGIDADHVASDKRISQLRSEAFIGFQARTEIGCVIPGLVGLVLQTPERVSGECRVVFDNGHPWTEFPHGLPDKVGIPINIEREQIEFRGDGHLMQEPGNVFGSDEAVLLSSPLPEAISTKTFDRVPMRLKISARMPSSPF